MKPSKIFFLFFLLAPQFLFGQVPMEKVRMVQETKDKELKAIAAADLWIFYLQVNEDSVAYFSEIALRNKSIGKLSDLGCQIADIQNLIIKKELIGLKEKIFKAKLLCKKFNEIDDLFTLESILGQMYAYNEEYVLASQTYNDVYFKIKKRALEHKTKESNENYVALLSQMFVLYYSMGDYVMTEKYGAEAIKAVSKFGDAAELATLHSNQGSVLVKMKRFHEAIQQYEKSKLLREQNNVTSILGYDDFTLAVCYRKLYDFPTAYSYIQVALQKHKEFNNEYIDLERLEVLNGLILIGLNRQEEAKTICEKIYKSEAATLNSVVKRDACECLRDVSKQLGNFKEAYKYQNEFQAFIDATNEKERASLMALKSKFFAVETDNLQDSLKLVESRKYERFKLEEQAKSLFFTRIGLLFLAVFIIGILVSLYYLRKLYTKNLTTSIKLKQSLNEKEIYLKEIHHRVKNNFQVISSLLNIQANFSTIEPEIQGLKDAQNRIMSMALVHQKLYGDVDISRVNMTSYFRDLVKHYKTTFFSDENKVHFKLKCDQVDLDLDKAVPLGLISNEIITNSMKYGRDDTGDLYLSIEMKFDGKMFSVLFKDSGTGFEPKESDQTSESIGLDLIEILTEQLDGTYEIKNMQGTQILIQFPA